MTNLGSGIRSLAGSIAGTAKSIGSSVVNAIKNAFAVAPSIGKNLIQGIWNGIKSMGNWIMGLIGDFASGIIAGIKEKFKIHSPSRVMRDEVGVMLAKGIGVGVDIETPKVTKDIVDNMDDITAKMQAAVYQEQARTSRAMTAGVNKTINNTTETVTNNDNGLTLKVDKFINNTKQDIKDIAEELEFYRKRNSLATGGV